MIFGGSYRCRDCFLHQGALAERDFVQSFRNPCANGENVVRGVSWSHQVDECHESQLIRGAILEMSVKAETMCDQHVL